MRFITITLIVDAPDPVTGERKSTQDRFPEVLGNERSSALIGSPAQVIEKVHRYHEQFGHSVLHLPAAAAG